MSETLCTLRTKGGGGGKYTETSLWTNPSPNADFAANGTITTSDSMTNYKYIAIKYKYSKNDSDAGLTSSKIIVSVEDLQKSTSDGSVRDIVTLGIRAANNYSFARMVFYTSATVLTVSGYYQISGTGTGTANVIPLEILGLNELSTEPVIMKKIGEISLPAGTATVTGNLSENISDYKNLLVSMVEYNGSSIPLTGIGSTVLGLFTTNYFASNNPVGYYGIGNQGSMSYYSITMQKMSDTSIKFTRSNTTGARTAYVYGIK